MVKISTVFVFLVIVGGAVLAALVLHSTLIIVVPSKSREVRRKVLSKQRPPVVLPNSRKATGLSLKDYRTKLNQILDNYRLQFDSQRQELSAVVNDIKENALQLKKKRNMDVFLGSHSALGYKQPVHDRSEINTAVDLATQFPFRSNFSFPQPKIMRTLDDISRAPWVTDLRHYLSTYNHSREISLVTSNSKYTDVLLNWLISATVKSKIPAKSILVISLDKTIHRLLLEKHFCSILVPPRTLIDRSVTFSEPFEEVMMTRLAVMRIINHFGYGFVMYDSDAVILKDPQPLYDTIPHEDIIGSVGKIPYDLAAEWGITICIGVVLVRSSPKTGKWYWVVIPLGVGDTFTMSSCLPGV